MQLGVSHGLERIEKFQMRRPDVGDDYYRRLDNRRQGWHLVGRGNTQFENTQRGVIRHLKQRQRYAKEIIQIAR